MFVHIFEMETSHKKLTILEKLPEEILEYIFNILSFPNLISCALTCKLFYHITNKIQNMILLRQLENKCLDIWLATLWLKLYKSGNSTASIAQLTADTLTKNTTLQELKDITARKGANIFFQMSHVASVVNRWYTGANVNSKIRDEYPRFVTKCDEANNCFAKLCEIDKEFGTYIFCLKRYNDEMFFTSARNKRAQSYAMHVQNKLWFHINGQSAMYKYQMIAQTYDLIPGHVLFHLQQINAMQK